MRRLICLVERIAKNAKPATTSRDRLLDAAISSVREKGYAATAVDAICTKAKVTKGAFFHYFPSKQSLAVAAVEHWSEIREALYANAPYHQFEDPLDRLLGYMDFRKAMLHGPLVEITCPVGALVQEIYESHSDIRRACEASIACCAAQVQSDIAAAIKRYHIRAPWTAESLAFHTQVVLQGAFVLAKAQGNAAVAAASIDHMRRYVELLFHRPTPRVLRKN